MPPGSYAVYSAYTKIVNCSVVRTKFHRRHGDAEWLQGNVRSGSSRLLYSPEGGGAHAGASQVIYRANGAKPVVALAMVLPGRPL